MSVPQMHIIDIVKFERKNFSFKTENKSCYVLTCRTDGESLFFYNNEKHLVKRGDVLYIPSGSSYSQECDSETLICFHLNISGQVSSKIELFSFNEQDDVCNLFLRAAHLWKHKPSNYELSCMSILYEIMSKTQICIDDRYRKPTNLLKPAIEYLDVHLCDADFSLERVCREAHISRTYFNRLFYEIYNCTPTVYVNGRRIERAKQLLTSGSCSNEEIAYLCGFNDVKYFYVIFKKLTGYTTKEYKREFGNLKNKSFVKGK